jgi:hypothetical protein
LPNSRRRILTDEDWEFNRIETEIKWRKFLTDNPPVAIPLITEEEWAALNEIPEA